MKLRNRYLCLSTVLFFACSVLTPPVQARGERVKNVWAFLNKPVEECVALAWQKARTDVATTKQRLAAFRNQVFRAGTAAFYDRLSTDVMDHVTRSVDEIGADAFCANVEQLSGTPLPAGEAGTSPELKRAWILRTMQKRLAELRGQVQAMQPAEVLGSIGSAECAVDDLEAGRSVEDVMGSLRRFGETGGSSLSAGGDEGGSRLGDIARGVLGLMVLLAVLGGIGFVAAQIGFGGIIAVTFILFYFVYYLQM